MAGSAGDLGSQLRQARETRGLSQRALSEKTGLTQAMISKIESGAVDPRLSTLTTFGRAVGLEVALVPPFARSAFSSMIKGMNKPTTSMTGEIREISKALENLIGTQAAADQFVESVREVISLGVDLRAKNAIVNSLMKLDSASPSDDPETFALVAEEQMRRMIAHADRLRRAKAEKLEDPRPAYSLEDESNDG